MHQTRSVTDGTRGGQWAPRARERPLLVWVSFRGNKNVLKFVVATGAALGTHETHKLHHFNRPAVRDVNCILIKPLIPNRQLLKSNEKTCKTSATHTLFDLLSTRTAAVLAEVRSVSAVFL